MLRRSCFALMLAFAAAACGKDTPTAPSASPAPRFTATLLPGNEVPPVTNADASASGVATITLNTTKDAAGTITAATADFQVTLAGFPANTTFTGAHIHNGVAGVIAGVVVNTGLANGEIVLPNGGSTSFSKLGINVDATLAQGIINNPAGFYLNVHTVNNTGGAVRAQLVRSN